jgi:hypothetical protein
MNDGAGQQRCRDGRKNSDASTARAAERMINLSTRGANEDGIFLHADVKAVRVRPQDSRPEPETAKTTPCTVAGACENNDLRIIRSLFDSSGKTGA